MVVAILFTQRTNVRNVEQMTNAKRIGFIVNPLAGIGGAVGLKGSDGAETVARARALGAVPQAHKKAQRAIHSIGNCNGLEIVTGPGALGEDITRESGMAPDVIAIEPMGDSRDTKQLVKQMQGRVDLILFAGGDGTACDIASVNAEDIPMLGIPSGVKMHSGLFARSPERAGQLVAQYLPQDAPRFAPAEVMDIDEDARRNGRISAQLFAIAQTLDSALHLQGPKTFGVNDVADLDASFGRYVGQMRSDTFYLIGPGTSMAALKSRFTGDASLLGVDVVKDGQIIAQDVSEAQILKLLADGGSARIVLSIVGGQGFLLGRGNQQFSPAVIRRVGRDAIDIFCSTAKLAELVPVVLTVDTGDPDLDVDLAGYVQVITGAGRRQVARVTH